MSYIDYPYIPTYFTLQLHKINEELFKNNYTIIKFYRNHKPIPEYFVWEENIFSPGFKLRQTKHFTIEDGTRDYQNRINKNYL